jgi:hypothetical protein
VGDGLPANWVGLGWNCKLGGGLEFLVFGFLRSESGVYTPD